EDVPEEDREEEGDEQRHVPRRFLGSQHRERDVLPHELDTELRQALQPAGDHTGPAQREEEEGQEQHEPQQDEEVDEVHAEGEPADTKRPSPAPPHEVLGGGSLEVGEDRARAPDHRSTPGGPVGVVHKSACSRPDSTFISKASNRMVQGTTASANARGEKKSSFVSTASIAAIV